MIGAIRDHGFRVALAVVQIAMQLTTLMEILEREIGASPSARSELAQLVAERGSKETAAQARTTSSEPGTDGSLRARSARPAR